MGHFSLKREANSDACDCQDVSSHLCKIVIPEAHNSSRSLSGTVCVFVPCYAKLRDEDGYVLIN